MTDPTTPDNPQAGTQPEQAAPATPTAAPAAGGQPDAAAAAAPVVLPPVKHLLTKKSEVHAYQVPPGEHVLVHNAMYPDEGKYATHPDWVAHNAGNEDITWILTDDYRQANYDDHGEIPSTAPAAAAPADPQAPATGSADDAAAPAPMDPNAPVGPGGTAPDASPAPDVPTPASAPGDPQLGRIVHFVLANGEHRPAIVVHPWESGVANLQVFLDGDENSSNDHDAVGANTHYLWATSIAHDEDAKASGTWHWPERG